MTKKTSLELLGIVVVGVVLTLMCMFLLDKLGYNVNKSVSPNKEYQVSYNRLRQGIVLQSFETGAKTGCTSGIIPAFCWSPNSKYLAFSCGTTYGNEVRLIIADVENAFREGKLWEEKWIWINIPLGIEQNDISKTRVKNLKFMDNDSIFVELDITCRSGDQASWWYTFDVVNWSVIEISLDE
ncbi:MAG: hypothetical protein FWE97_00265 [Dehalococcoidia bacterium]|nr:hypothetical protein [Dehalococcoidia bacterium]